MFSSGTRWGNPQYGYLASMDSSVVDEGARPADIDKEDSFMGPVGHTLRARR